MGITATFDAFIGSGSGADGLTFTLADASVTQPTALGVNGGGEGFSGVTGIAVSLDTWKNAVNPSNNFVGIANGSVPGAGNELNYVATNTSIPSLENATHHFVVTTTSTGITVTMDGTQVLNYATTSLPPYVLVGFTGGTGGFNDIHQVQNVSITAASLGVPVPNVTGLTPTSGPSTGTTSVTITGTGFTGVSAVNFGATAATFTVNNATTITAAAPAGTIGTTDVTVTSLGGTSAKTASDKYTYTPPPAPAVTSITPSSGPSTGATAVTITGTNLAGATAVKFGSTAATFTVNGSTTITATSPAGSIGTIDVTVTTPGGTSTTTAADQYVYTPPPAPTVTGVSPSSGPSTGATSIAITGSSFTGATAVDFGATAATFTVNNATTITATAPAGALGTIDVTVTTPGGTSVTSAADHYTYVLPPAPTVTGVSPSTGPSFGTTTVTLTGTSFTGATAVSFGTNAATFTVNNATTITATAPAGTSGVVDVTVTAPGGTSGTSAADHYTYLPPPAPTVTGVSPSTGPSGSLVTLSGTSFTGASVVDFGSGNPAATFTVNNATTITATAPAGTPGLVDVTVATPGGMSATSAADQVHLYRRPGSVPGSLAGRRGLAAQRHSPAQHPRLARQLAADDGHQLAGGLGLLPHPGRRGRYHGFLRRLHRIELGTGADGLTFTLADAGVTQATALGVNGGGEGFSGIAGFAVSLDTWKNAVNPSNNFVGIANGPVPGVGNELNYLTTNSSIAPLRNAWHHFVVTTSSTGITVSMDGLQVLNYATSLPPYVLVGFTAGTGGFNDVHQVENVVITATGTPPPAPTVTAVSPAGGPSSGGTSVTITGTNFTGAAAINFGSGNPSDTYTITSPTTIIATTPTGKGTVDVTVTTPGGTSATSAADQYTFVSGPPVVTGVSPNFGPVTGGTTVTITGTNFTDANAVVFGPANPATTFTIVNFTTIVATAPIGQLGVYDVQVSNPSGTSGTVTADQYTYTSPPVPTVTGVSPASGPSTGGTAVTITGTGFAGALSVNFGSGNPSATYTVSSSSAITATAPPGPLGTVDVTVTSAGGTSVASAADEYTYVAPPAPTVTGVSPGTGPIGTLLTITGTNLSGATAVDFGQDNPATTITVSNATTLYASAPPGTGSVDVTVTTPGGTSATSAADQFTYTVPPPPTVTGVSPNSGFSSYSIVVTGTNFTGASAVEFGATAASFTVNSATSITATAPSGSGSVDVTVTTSGGTSATSAADQFTYSGGTPVTEVATYRADLGRSGYYPSATGLTPANVTSLKLHWTDTGGTGSYAQPIVANNMVYWGDWNGLEHGTTLSGTDLWTTNLGVNTDSSCLPPVAGVSGTATAAMMGTTPVLYVPGGADNFYALNALTGAVIWETSLGTPPGDYLWASPILYDGSIYEGVASFGDCPLVQGQLVQMDAVTGAIQHVANMVPDGCIGGGIWSSPTIDTSDGSIYVTTGTPNGCGTPGELAPSIVKLRASDLTILSSWTVPPSELYDDPDFGSTPTLFTATINGVARQLVGAINKDGLFFAWDRNNLAAGPVWQTRIANPAGGPLSIVSAAWDGSRLYVGGGNTIINGTSCYENISALNPATGAFIWRSCVQGSMTSGITEVPGMLVEGYGATGKVVFLNPANGATFFIYSPAAAVEGEVTVSNGVVYVPLSNGNLIALGQ